MDLADQLAAVWARRTVVLAAALLAAGVVFAWRSSVPPRYESTATVQIRLPAGSAGDPTTEVDYYAQTVVGLATSWQVVATALDLSGRDDDVSTVVDEVSAEPADEPGFVVLHGFGSSAVDATKLANALATAVANKVAAEQSQDVASDRASLGAAIAEVDARIAQTPAHDAESLASLNGERDALVGALRTAAGDAPWLVREVEAAQLPSGPAGPQPARAAGLAFLVVAVLAAEAVVVRRRWRGQLSVRDPAGSVTGAHGLPAVAVPAAAGPEALAALLPALSPARVVTVVHRVAPPRARTSVLLATLLAPRQDVLLVDGCALRPSVHAELGLPTTPGLTDLPRQERPLRDALAGLATFDGVRVLPAGDPGGARRAAGTLARLVKTDPADVVVVAGAWDRWDELSAVFGELGGPVLLELDVRTATHSMVRSELETLRGLGAEIAAVVVVAPASRRRRRSRRVAVVGEPGAARGREGE